MEDVGCVRVKVAACEGLCSVRRCVAGVLERIVPMVIEVTASDIAPWFKLIQMRFNGGV